MAVIARQLSARGLIGRAISGRSVGALRQGGSADPISILGDKLAAWYTSDPATLFTTSTGETPVTAAGEPVGLRLDKSQGMELGPEVIPDPSFDDAGAWSLSTGVAVTGGKAVWTATSNNSFVRAVGVTTLGRYYEVTVVVDSISEGGLSITTSAGTGLGVYPTVSAPGTYTFRLIATGTSNSFQIFSAGASTTASVSSATCREIAGNHARQTTSAARPLWQTGPDRVVYDGVDDELVTTFAATVGADCTVARAIPGAGASITTGVSIGTSFTDNVTAQELVIANAALTAGETAALTAYLNRVAGV